MDDEFNRKQSISAPKAGTQTEQSQRNQDTLDPILKNVLVILLNNSRKGCRFSALILGHGGVRQLTSASVYEREMGKAAVIGNRA